MVSSYSHRTEQLRDFCSHRQSIAQCNFRQISMPPCVLNISGVFPQQGFILAFPSPWTSQSQCVYPVPFHLYLSVNVIAIVWIFVSPRYLYIEAIISSVLVLEVGASGSNSFMRVEHYVMKALMLFYTKAERWSLLHVRRVLTRHQICW